MSMQSSSLLPALRKLPRGESGQQAPFREQISSIVNMDRAMDAAESASSVSAGMWFLFDDRNVLGIDIPYTGVNLDDDLRETMAQAHRLAFPSESRTVWEHWKDAYSVPGTFDNTFMSPFKGKFAELETNRLLESDGWTHMTLAPGPGHPYWDNIGIAPDGRVAVIQSKTGESYSASDVQRWMAEDHPNLYEQVNEDVQRWVANPEILERHPQLATIAERLAEGPDSFVPDRYFAFGSELYGTAVSSTVDEVDRIVADLGSAAELEGTTSEGLGLLSDNMGIDIPDGVVELVPYAATIFAATRLLVSVLRTEREFQAADRTTKNRIQVVQTLTLMSRMGITTVCAAGGGVAGGAVGSVVPGVGNLVGGIAGSIGGAGIGRYLNRHLQPHMLNLALNITGLTNDDLFYYKNKPRIDATALSFESRARALATAGALCKSDPTRT